MPECADFLKVSADTVLEMAGDGTLPGAKVGRAWVFLEDDLVDFLKAQVKSQGEARVARVERRDQATTAVDESRRRGRPRRPIPDPGPVESPSCIPTAFNRARRRSGAGT